MEADDTVGRIIRSLRANGLLDNTFVFVSSDNGQSFDARLVCLLRLQARGT